MFQNLKFIFSHQDIIILYSIFLLIMFVVYPIKKLNLKSVRRIIVACCLWWLLLVFIYPPKGFNFRIYTYNASLTLNGQKSFGRDTIKFSDEYKNLYKKSYYLDYTGAQHLLYISLESLNLSRFSPKLYGLGFQCWTIINFVIILLLIYNLNNSYEQEINADKIWPIIFLSFCPVIPFYILITNWEDKLIFLLLPLLLLLLIKLKKYRLSSLFLGFVIAFNGILFFFLPIYLIFLFKNKKESFWLNTGLIFLAFIITMIPFFPESLAGWTNRLKRVNTDEPFWYSFYTLLPRGIYSTILNSAIIITGIIVMVLFYLFKKINLVDSVIISVSIIIIISPYNGTARVIPLILLLNILAPNINRYNWLILFFILSIFLLFDSGYITPIVNVENTILFYIPLIYSITIYCYKRFKYKQIAIL